VRLGNLMSEGLMSPLKFRKMHFGLHVVHRFDSMVSNVSTYLTGISRTVVQSPTA
jgi:hypothetical protein